MKKDDSNTTVLILKDAVRDFAKDRDWNRYHTPRNFAESISIEAAELLEVFQWSLREDEQILTEDSTRREMLREELADVVIYCLGLANVTGIDLADAVFNKLEMNEKKYPVELCKGTYTKPANA